MSDEPQEGEYGLVMPFIVTTSHDGPYDDAAFVAGWTAGAIDAAINALSPPSPLVIPKIMFQVPRALLPQMDLILMRHGWSSKVTHYEDEVDPDGYWAEVTACRPGFEDDDDAS